MRSLMFASVCSALVALAGCGSDAPGGYSEPDAAAPDGPEPDADAPPICCVTTVPDAGSTGGSDAASPPTDAGGSGETDGNVGAPDGGSGESDGGSADCDAGGGSGDWELLNTFTRTLTEPFAGSAPFNYRLRLLGVPGRAAAYTGRITFTLSST